jgi:hypothetical protein
MTTAGPQLEQDSPAHWHSAYTIYAPDGTLAGITSGGPFGSETDARQHLTGKVTSEQGDLMVMSESGHKLTLAEVWELLDPPAIFTLPGDDSRTFSTYPCAGDCDASREAHVAALPARIAETRRPVREIPPARSSLPQSHPFLRRI